MPSVSTAFKPSPHDEAANFLRGLPVVEREVWSELLPELRALAFTIKLTQQGDNEVKKGEFLRIMEESKALIASIPAGASSLKVTKQIAAKLTPYFPTPMQAYRRAVLLVRHWNGMVEASFQYRRMVRIVDDMPYWKYVTYSRNYEADNVRPTHAALDGKIVPASSPFWDTHYPPWAPMCRCRVVAISQGEYNQIKAREESLPLERRSIIEGPQLAELEKSNRLLTAIRYPQPDGTVRYGNLEGISVAPDTGWNGWNPRDLRIDFATLQERYKDQPDALRKLMERAEKIEAAPGVKLSDYIRGLGDGKKLSPIATGATPNVQRPTPNIEPKKPEPGTADVPSATQPKLQPSTHLEPSDFAAENSRRLARRLKRWSEGLTPDQIRQILRLLPDTQAAFGFYTFPLDGRKVVIPVKLFR